MGVRGLATLARKRGGSTLETIDADTTLLIDGSGLCAHALQNQRCEYGGDLGALDAATTQFLERLLNRDFPSRGLLRWRPAKDEGAHL